MKVIWVSTWGDPGKEADAAKALIDQGVDVIIVITSYSIHYTKLYESTFMAGQIIPGGLNS